MTDECYHTKYEGCEPCEHDLKRAIDQLTAERDAHKEWHEKCDRALRATLAERDRYRESLVACAECGYAGDTCLDLHPTDVNQWCQYCIAVAARALDSES